MWGDHARERVAAQAARLIVARSTTSFELSCAKQSGTPTPAKKTWLTAAGSTDRTAASSVGEGDRKSTRLNSSHGYISYAVFCLKKKKRQITRHTRLGVTLRPTQSVHC